MILEERILRDSAEANIKHNNILIEHLQESIDNIANENDKILDELGEDIFKLYKTLDKSV